MHPLCSAFTIVMWSVYSLSVVMSLCRTHGVSVMYIISWSSTDETTVRAQFTYELLLDIYATVFCMYCIVRIISPWAISLTSALNVGLGL